MDLHVWVSHKATEVSTMTGPQGRQPASDSSAVANETREPLPGSPFQVFVSEGNASAVGSFVKDAEAKQASGGGQGGFVAGEHVLLKPQVRDQFGNASTAPEGALTAEHEIPGEEEVVHLEPPTMRGGVGSYELGLEPVRAGTHVVHIKLHGEEISGSPVSFKVTPGGPSVQKCYLTKPEKQAIEKVPFPIVATLVDKYGNKLDRGGVRVDAKALGTATAAVEDRKDGTYLITITAAAPGEVKLTVRIDSTELTPTMVVTVTRAYQAEATADADAPEAAASPAPALNAAVPPLPTKELAGAAPRKGSDMAKAAAAPTSPAVPAAAAPASEAP